MDTKTLIADAKARFAHNSAKEYLREKYEAKLLVAEQGGLWKADKETISFLHSCPYGSTVMIDTFGNPVQVNNKDLRDKLQKVYREVMSEWYNEWTELESNR